MDANSRGSWIGTIAVVGWIAFAWFYPMSWDNVIVRVPDLGSDERAYLMTLTGDDPLRWILRKNSIVTLAIDQADGTAPIERRGRRVLNMHCTSLASTARCLVVVSIDAQDLSYFGSKTVVRMWLQIQ